MEFEIGEKVAVHGYDIRIHKVVRLMKRFIELDDGSKFNYDGNPYPYVEFSNMYISKCTEKMLEDADRSRCCRILEKTNWVTLPIECLHKVIQIINLTERKEGVMLWKKKR